MDDVLAEIDKAGEKLARILTDDRVRPFGSDRIYLAAHDAQNALARARRLAVDWAEAEGMLAAGAAAGAAAGTTDRTAEAVETVLEATEWNGWPGRGPLSERLRRAVRA